MSRFSNALRATMEKRGLTQTAVCAQSGLIQATFSRYINGELRPPPPRLEKIFAAFTDKSDRDALFLAYLADGSPAEYRDLIRLGTAGVSPNKKRIPNELRTALDFLETAALEHQPTADTLIAFYRLLSGKK